MSGQIRDPNALIRIEDAIRVLCGKTCHPGVFCPDNYCMEMWEAFDGVQRINREAKDGIAEEAEEEV